MAIYRIRGSFRLDIEAESSLEAQGKGYAEIKLRNVDGLKLEGRTFASKLYLEKMH